MFTVDVKQQYNNNNNPLCEGLYVKFVRDSPASTHRQNPQKGNSFLIIPTLFILKAILKIYEKLELIESRQTVTITVNHKTGKAPPWNGQQSITGGGGGGGGLHQFEKFKKGPSS